MMTDEKIKLLEETPNEAAQLLRVDLQLFIKVFHYYVTKQDFVFKPFHKKIIAKLESIVYDKPHNLVISISPRFGKSAIMRYFVAWTYAINKNCNNIYTSYSDELVRQFSGEIRDLVNSKLYQKLFNTRIKEDTQNKGLWQVENGGSVRACSMGGSITGFGCFDYNTLISTENGFEKIGDIVESKKDVRVWTFNIEKNKMELSRISRYLKYENADFLKVKLETGEEIKATPDHPFYDETLSDKQISMFGVLDKVRANIFDPINVYSKNTHNLFSGIIPIKDKANLFLRKFLKKIIKESLSATLISDTSCNLSPNYTTFNITNAGIRYAIIFGNLLIWSSIFGYCYGFLGSKFLELTVLIELVICILLRRTIAQVLKSIVRRVRIKVAAFASNWLFSDKSKKNKGMNSTGTLFGKTTKSNPFISFTNRLLAKYLFGFITKHFATLANKISFIPRDREILGIVKDNHKNSCYCVSLCLNNNFFIGKSQVLVHNCGNTTLKGYGGCLLVDDPLKADDAHSEKAKRDCWNYFTETLLSRRNSENTPIIIIMQRLAVDDIVGILKKNNAEFEYLEFPVLDEDNQSIWPERFSTEALLKLQREQPGFFAAQYMQNPVVEGGNLFKDYMFVRGPIPEHFDYTFITCDTASTSKTTSDYTAAGFWGVHGDGDNKRLYLLDLLWDKIDSAQSEQYLVPFIQKHSRENFIGALIEPKGHGIYLNQRMPLYNVPMQPPDRVDEFFKDRRLDKVARANIIIPQLVNNPIFVGEGITEDTFLAIKRELMSFPDGEHDDFTDTLIDAVKWCYNRTPSILDVL